MIDYIIIQIKVSLNTLYNIHFLHIINNLKIISFLLLFLLIKFYFWIGEKSREGTETDLKGKFYQYIIKIEEIIPKGDMIINVQGSEEVKSDQKIPQSSPKDNIPSEKVEKPKNKFQIMDTASNFLFKGDLSSE